MGFVPRSCAILLHWCKRSQAAVRDIHGESKQAFHDAGD